MPVAAASVFGRGFDLATGRFGAVGFGFGVADRRFGTGADLSTVGFLRLADVRAGGWSRSRVVPPFPAAWALAFLRACLAAFLLAFANFRARLSTAFARRTCRFAVSARAAAFCDSARSRCAAADCFAPGFCEAATMQGLVRKIVGR